MCGDTNSQVPVPAWLGSGASADPEQEPIVAEMASLLPADPA